MKKILVTGANGQLAQDILLLSSHFSNYEFYFYNRKELDITDREQVKTTLEKLRPDYIINTAAYTQVDQAEKEIDAAYAVNAYGIQNIVQEANKSRIIHLSTDYVYHSQVGIPLKEDAPLNPRSIYARSKLLGEEILINAHQNYIIIRTSWVYGPHGKNFLKTMLKLGGERSELRIINDQLGAPTYTFDLARAILQFIDGTEKLSIFASSWNEIYNYASDGVTSWFEFAQEIFKQAKINIKLIPIPTYQYPTPAIRPHWSVLDLEKIMSVPGIEVLPWKISLTNCLKRIIN